MCCSSINAIKISASPALFILTLVILKEYKLPATPIHMDSSQTISFPFPSRLFDAKSKLVLCLIPKNASSKLHLLFCYRSYMESFKNFTLHGKLNEEDIISKCPSKYIASNITVMPVISGLISIIRISNNIYIWIYISMLCLPFTLFIYIRKLSSSTVINDDCFLEFLELEAAF